MHLPSYIEHTLLKSTATLVDIETLCNEAVEHHFYGVCVPGCYVAYARNLLTEQLVKVITVVGFPLGNEPMESKVSEAERAIKLGAYEIDMVINIGFLKSGLHEKVAEEISAVKKTIGNHTLKVIIETCFLTNEEIEVACELCMYAGADFIKTSTGYGTGGATVKDVQLIKSIIKDTMKIKASGGISDRAMALELIDAGADRIGTSNGVKLLSKTNT